jgi:Predicted phosphohydrolases
MLRRRTFLRNLIGAGVLGAGTPAYAHLLERHSVRIELVPLDLGLGHPLRIAAISDVHFDPLFETGYLRHIFALIDAAEPDLVCHLGDYVTRSTKRFDEFAALAARVQARLGSFAVLGNHDQWSDDRVIVSALESAGVRVLRNESVPIPGVSGWQLAGLESYWGGRPNPAAAMPAEADVRFILLVHEPDPFDIIRDPRARLQISGHTHGGQIRAPFFGALRLPSWGRNYDAGLFRDGDRHLYVTRGVGTVSIPMRFHCPPEITLFELS